MSVLIVLPDSAAGCSELPPSDVVVVLGGKVLGGKSGTVGTVRRTDPMTAGSTSGH